MPSDASYWLISAPLKHGDETDLFKSIKTVVTDNTQIGGLELPSLKVSGRYREYTRRGEGDGCDGTDWVVLSFARSVELWIDIPNHSLILQINAP